MTIPKETMPDRAKRYTVYAKLAQPCNTRCFIIRRRITNFIISKNV